MTISVEELVKSAIEASQYAYVPYSKYRVGAALLTLDGVIFKGCNVENAAYPACICGERTALVKAVSDGYQQFSTIVVATLNGGSPCGVCRQMLFEFAPDMRVICATFEGEIIIDQPLRELLQHGFGPKNLVTS